MQGPVIMIISYDSYDNFDSLIINDMIINMIIAFRREKNDEEQL